MIIRRGMSVKGNLHSLRKISPKMLFESPKVDFSHRKMFSRSRFFFLASQERPSTRVQTSCDRHFDQHSKALWCDDVRWLPDSHALGKFAAKCRIASLQAKNKKKDPKICFHKFLYNATIQ